VSGDFAAVAQPSGLRRAVASVVVNSDPIRHIQAHHLAKVRSTAD